MYQQRSHYDFIKEQVNSVGDFFSNYKLLIFHYGKISTPFLLDFFIFCFKKDYKNKVEKMDKFIHVLDNYSSFANDLYSLRERLKKEDVKEEELKEHNLYELYSFLSFVNHNNSENVKDRHKKVHIKNLAVQKYKRRISLIEKIDTRIYHEDGNTSLTKEEIKTIRDFYHYLLTEHFIFREFHSLQSDVVLENTGVRSLNNVLNTRFSQMRSLKTLLERSEHNILDDIIFSDEDKEKMKQNKIVATMHQDFKDREECVKMNILNELNDVKNRIARF